MHAQFTMRDGVNSIGVPEWRPSGGALALHNVVVVFEDAVVQIGLAQLRPDVFRRIQLGFFWGVQTIARLVVI